MSASPPSKATLAKYGLSEAEWLAILKGQRDVCFICKKVPESGRWVTDHRHVPGYKKMSPFNRRKHVRGILCGFCNSHVVGRFVTLEKARNLVLYLEQYHGRIGS